MLTSKNKLLCIFKFIIFLLILFTIPRILVYLLDIFFIKFWGLSLNYYHSYYESFFAGMWHSFLYSFFSNDVFYKSIVNCITIILFIFIIFIYLYLKKHKYK